LAKLLRERGGTYAATIAPQFQSFATDARTRAAIERANAALRDLEKNGR
jgi:hypothetical protein